MTTPTPLPIDISALLDPLPDLAHETLRSHVVDAITAVWTNHLALLDQLTATQTDLAATEAALATAQTALTQAQTDVTDLQARVTALENPTPPAS